MYFRYVYAILLTLSCIGKVLYNRAVQEKFDHFLIMIQIYLNKRSKKHHPALRVWSSGAPHPQEEYLDYLWTQVSKLGEDDWTMQYIWPFHSILRGSLTHDLPPLVLPPHHESYSYPLPTVVFRMFIPIDSLKNHFYQKTISSRDF